MNTIGKNFEETLQYINDPVSQYFIPYPTKTMACAEMESNMNKITAQIRDWNSVLNSLTYKLFSGDRIKAGNLNSIIDIQTRKFEDYEKEFERCNVPEPETNPGTTTTTTTTTENGNGGEGTGGVLLAVGLGVAAIWFLSRKKKR